MMKYLFIPALILFLFASCSKNELEVNSSQIAGEYIGDYVKNLKTDRTEANFDNEEFHFQSDGRLIYFSDEAHIIDGQSTIVRVSDTLSYSVFGENQMRIFNEDFEEITYTIIKNDEFNLVMTYTDENRHRWEIGLKRK